MSNQKIEVLAVMDKLQEAVDALGREGERRYHRDGMFHLELGPKHYSSMMLQDELIEARAAVASLTEWTGVAEKFLSSLRTGDELEVEAWTIAESLRAAIARIGGAA